MLRKSFFCACAALVLAAGFAGSAAAKKKAPAAADAEPVIKGKLRHTVIAADGSKHKVLKIYGLRLNQSYFRFNFSFVAGFFS